jgi:hypothetical protein
MQWTMKTHDVDLLFGMVLGMVLTVALGWRIAQLVQS